MLSSRPSAKHKEEPRKFKAARKGSGARRTCDVASCRRGTYIESMARGWESKGVESQREEASFDSGRAKRSLTAEQRETEQKRYSLLLSRTRVLRDLETSSSERYRKNLEDALAFLDNELERLARDH